VTDQLEDLVSRRLRPILTHPERNPLLQRAPERVLEWIGLGCAVQVTASALAGLWGEKAKMTADWLLEREAVHILASDCHGVKQRPPILSEARDLITRRFGAALANALVRDNPGAVVGGKPLPYFPKISG
jgi:protein-tyrosine phosphatase